MNTILKLGVVGISVCFGAIALQPEQAQALIRTYDFTVEMDFPVTDGPFSGSFRLNDASSMGSGFEILNIFNLTFEFQGQRFTEADSLFGGNGAASFLNGEFVGLDFGVQDDLIDPTVDFLFISGGATSPTTATGEFINNLDFSTGLVTYRLTNPAAPPVPEPQPPVSVPEPPLVFGLMSVASLGFVVRRKWAGKLS